MNTHLHDSDDMQFDDHDSNFSLDPIHDPFPSVSLKEPLEFQKETFSVHLGENKNFCFPEVHSSLHNIDNEEHSAQYWKSLYEEQMKNNQRMKFEKESYQDIIRSFSQIITEEEYEILTEIPDQEELKQIFAKVKNSKSEEVENESTDKKFIDMSVYEFVDQIMFEYPECTSKKIKLLLDKRAEAVNLMKELSFLKLSFVMKTIDQLMNLFYEMNDEESKKKKFEFFHQTIMNQKEEIRSIVEKEFLIYIEKNVKGKNNPLPEDSKKILKTWFLQNFKHPYPKDAEKEVLQNETGLTRTQINNWFINKRVRV
jgi:hypothetical protein